MKSFLTMLNEAKKKKLIRIPPLYSVKNLEDYLYLLDV